PGRSPDPNRTSAAHSSNSPGAARNPSRSQAKPGPSSRTATRSPLPPPRPAPRAPGSDSGKSGPGSCPPRKRVDEGRGRDAGAVPASRPRDQAGRSEPAQSCSDSGVGPSPAVAGSARPGFPRRRPGSRRSAPSPTWPRGRGGTGRDRRGRVNPTGVGLGDLATEEDDGLVSDDSATPDMKPRSRDVTDG